MARPLHAVLLSVLLALPMPARAAGRLAIVVGENRGLPGEASLRYAESDARKMAKVLVDLGEFAPAEVHTLLAPTAGELRAFLEGLPSDPDSADGVLLLLRPRRRASAAPERRPARSSRRLSAAWAGCRRGCCCWWWMPARAAP